MNKRILYQSDYELWAFQVVGKTLTEVQRFQVENEGEAEFIAYLKQDVKMPIFWLIDTSLEEYQTTLLPHVIGKDHYDLMNHKMKRLFDYTSYTYGIVQGRETKGRGDDRVLFMAIQNQEFLQPWLDLILQFKVPLVGIFSLPLLSERLLKHLPKAPYSLLVAHTPQISAHSPAGLRQSFFVHQKLQFSRLIPLTAKNSKEYAEYVLTQLIKTHNFLINARMLPQTDPPQQLLIIILTETTLTKALTQSLNYDPSRLKIHILDSQDFAYQIGLHTESHYLYLQHLVAYQLSRRWYVSNHYAHAFDIRYFLYRRLRLTLYVLSGLVLLGAGIVGSMILEQAAVVKQKVLLSEQQIVKLEKEIIELRQKKPDLPLDILFIRNIVDVGRYIEARHILPKTTWINLSRVLNRHPDLFIERLEWGIGHSKADLFQNYSGKIREEEESEEDSEDSPNSIDPTENFLEGVRIYGKITSFKGNYQIALQTFNHFVEDLRQQKNFFWQIEELQSPYNAEDILQGHLDPQKQEENKTPFIVDILIKHNYAPQSHF